MPNFPTGRYDRDAMSTALRSLSPAESFRRLEDIDVRSLAEAGKRLVLLDVDNTLLPLRGTVVDDSKLDWLDQGRASGLSFCLVSNTGRVDRLEQLSKATAVPYVRDRFKPSRRMFKAALDQFGVQPNETVMIGDQILTDILGANRTGIDAIWVRPIDPKEFPGTKFNRVFEWFVRRRLSQHLVTDPNDEAPFVPKVGIFRRQIVRQLIKFVIVGGSCFIIDAGLHRLLIYHVSIGGQSLVEIVGHWWMSVAGGDVSDTKAVYVAANTILKIPTAAIAILNSFIWNRRWTFRIVGPEDRLPQLRRFVLVSMIGLGLNALFMNITLRLLPESFVHRWATATVIAAGLVAVWNFSGQRLWALKRRPS